MQFANPEYLWLMLIVLPCIAWYVYTIHNRHPSLSISTTTPYTKLGRPFKQYLLYAMFGIKMLLLCVLIVILARPQTDAHWSSTKTSGTDIVIALDISSSMLAQDFDPDRLGAAKEMAKRFIGGRKSDNIGLVIFAGESFSAVPMTTDHTLLTNYIDEVNVGMLEDMTAIGDGLASAINRLKEGKAESKSIILLTDGTNNAGIVNPRNAGEIAKQHGIKVYTIGIGKNGNARFPVMDQFGHIHYESMPVVIDEETLKDIAQMTGGNYFRATDNEVLHQVFNEIDKLQKSEIDVKKFAVPIESYLPWALFAMALLGIELICRTLVLRHIP